MSPVQCLDMASGCHHTFHHVWIGLQLSVWWALTVIVLGCSLIAISEYHLWLSMSFSHYAWTWSLVICHFYTSFLLGPLAFCDVYQFIFKRQFIVWLEILRHHQIPIQITHYLAEVVSLKGMFFHLYTMGAMPLPPRIWNMQGISHPIFHSDSATTMV